MSEKNKITQELIKLDRDIRIALWVAIVIIIVVPGSYCLWFVLQAKLPISIQPGDWGTFGDYFGGLLNPVMGLFALYWLTKSVRLQKEELFETRSELAKQVEMAALTALTNSIMAEVDILRNNSAFLCDQLSERSSGYIWNTDGAELSITDAKIKVAEINNRISVRLVERLDYENNIKAMLNHKKL